MRYLIAIIFAFNIFHCTTPAVQPINPQLAAQERDRDTLAGIGITFGRDTLVLIKNTTLGFDVTYQGIKYQITSKNIEEILTAYNLRGPLAIPGVVCSLQSRKKEKATAP